VTDRASALQFGIVLAIVAVGHLSLIPNVADLDGFYHIGHAGAYLERSLFDTSLPWATRSVIGDIGGDLWWGFHVLLIPFALLGDVPVGLLSAAVVLTSVLGLTFMRVLRRHVIDHPGVWAGLFLIAVPNVFYRHLMVRPHVISLAASLALTSVLVRGRWWQVALLSAVIAWVHLSLFWIAPVVAIAYAVVRVPVTAVFGRERPDTGVPIRQAVPAAFLGALMGWLLRPDAIATATLLNVQLVQLFAQKATEQPLTFAAELAPIGIVELLATSWSFGLAWLATVTIVVRAAWRGDLGRVGQSRATLAVLGLVLSSAFLVLALVSARRALEQWVAFGMLSMPFAWHMLDGRSFRRGVYATLGLFLAAHLVWGAHRQRLNLERVSFPATTLAAVAEYLEENSEPGEVVFHARWDNFGPLFAHNRSNRYLGGMDPIFQYAHDPASYWEFFYLSADLTNEWTCDAYPCGAGVATDTYEALRHHFGARWVVVQPYRNPRLSLYLLNDDRYALAFETRDEALFQILGP
jgi:hypothetical protein